VRTPVRNPPVPVYAELETHRTMIRDRIRTEAFRRALETSVRPGDVVLDVGTGTGILSLLAARAGARRVYAVEQTSIARVAEELIVSNGLGDVVEVIQSDIVDVELPERVDVLVSEWLGGFGIDEGMLVPVLIARDRWLKPEGVMIPSAVVAWTALVEDPYVAETLEFLRDRPYGLDLNSLAEKTVNEVFYSGPGRRLEAGDVRSGAAVLWTTDAARISLPEAEAPHEADVVLPISGDGIANALGLWFSAELAVGTTLSISPGNPSTHWGMTTAPLREPVQLRAGSVVRARVRSAPALSMGTWTRWALQSEDGAWEEHDEQLVWAEIEG
jgi:SAM-dependent methyltransferase